MIYIYKAKILWVILCVFKLPAKISVGQLSYAAPGQEAVIYKRSYKHDKCVYIQ